MTIDIPQESPQGKILNYSIDSSDQDEEKPLKLKLKLSKTNFEPIVVLKRLENERENYELLLRHSPRTRKQKSFEGFETDLSKMLTTPKKRRAQKDDLRDNETTSPPKLRRSTRTPRKRYDFDYSMEDMCGVLQNIVSVSTPLSKGDSAKKKSNVKENGTPKKSREIDAQQTPRKSVRVNLDESFRKILLKSKHNAENISTPRTKTYDSDEEESDQDFMPTNKRVLRSRSVSTTSSDNLEVTPKKRARKPTTSKTPKSCTSKSRLKLLREGIITPSMHSRSGPVPDASTPLMKARTHLHVAYVPASLPCREKEYLDVYNFLRGKLADGCSGCMYISGVPGTGKTATVTSVIDNLAKDEKVPSFRYVSINGMRLAEPRQAYVEIWKQLNGKTVPWEQAQSLLEENFTKKKKQQPVVMLIDELDILCTKRQDVVYNLLDWPAKSKDRLIVITIANTMDLPERLLMSRVTSRLGLTRLTFQAYTHKQLMEIVTKRLTGTDSFNSDAVQLVARKVASVSGDARRALDICRRAAEIAEQEDEGQTVNIMHINGALMAMITQPQVAAIRRCSRLQKLLLQAIVAEVERTGVEETTFVEVFRMLPSCCALDGFKMVSSTTAQRALYQLSACKLILTDQKCGDIYQKIMLNVSVHDVYFALKKD